MKPEIPIEHSLNKLPILSQEKLINALMDKEKENFISKKELDEILQDEKLDINKPIGVYNIVSKEFVGLIIVYQYYKKTYVIINNKNLNLSSFFTSIDKLIKHYEKKYIFRNIPDLEGV